MDEKILIVDDEPDIVKVIQHRLETEMYKTAVAYDGQQALEKVKSEKPNLIILDIIMPKTDGFAVCQKIKKDPETAKIPIVILTAKTALSDKEQGFSYGAEAYLTKPFDLEELVNLVKQMLSNI